MTSLEKLKAYFDRKIMIQYDELITLESEQEKKKEINEYLAELSNSNLNIELVNKFFEFNLLSKPNEDLLRNKILNLKTLERILQEIQSQHLNIEEVKKLLYSINLIRDIDKDEIILNLTTIRNIKNIIGSDDDFNSSIGPVYDAVIKKIESNYEKLEEEIKTEIKNVSYSSLIKVDSGKISECEKRLENLKNFCNFLSIDLKTIVKPFKSQEMMNEFFELVKESDLNEQEVIEVLDLFIRYNFSKYYQNNLIVTSALENNKIAVYDELKSQLQEELEDTSSNDFKETEQSIDQILETLTDSEKQIYNKIIELTEIYSDEVDEEDAILLDSFQDLKIDGTELYMNGDQIDWSLLILYVKNILIPNLTDNKNEVIKIFETILENYRKVEDKNKNIKQIREELGNLCDNIDSYLDEYAGIINGFYELNEKQKNYCLTIIKMIKENQDIVIIEQNIKSFNKTLSWFTKLSQLLELNNYKEIVENTLDNNVSEEELKRLIKNIRDYLDEYNKNKVELDNEFREKISNQEDKEEENDEFCSIENRANMILFNIDDDINLYDSDQKQKFKSCIQLLYNNQWSDLRKQNPNHMIEKLRYSLPNGLQKNYSSKYEPFRIKVKKIDQIRTGIVKIPVNPSNAKKIKDRYNLVHECNSIFIIIGAINLKGDHSNYKYFHDVIRKKEKYLDYVTKLFNNPNCDENDMFKVIDENINFDFSLLKDKGGEQK